MRQKDNPPSILNISKLTSKIFENISNDTLKFYLKSFFPVSRPQKSLSSVVKDI